MELRGDREVVIARAFDAPARAVFDALTRPELVRRWWAPRSRGVELVVCDADVRVGGAYRYVVRARGGHEVGFSGRYTELTPHARFVFTQVFEPMAEAGEAVITVTLAERDGRTHLRMHEAYPSAAARDAALASGMEAGMRETMDQLDELVATVR